MLPVATDLALIESEPPALVPPPWSWSAGTMTMRSEATREMLRASTQPVSLPGVAHSAMLTFGPM